MKALLVAIGSHGDVHPFIGIGLALRARGHEVTVAAAGHFEPLARRVGLDFFSVISAQEYQELAMRPELWHPAKGLKLLMENTVRMMRPVYEMIAKEYVSGGTVVAASTLGLGARVAQEKLGVPLATVHLQPAILRTNHDVPRLPGSPLRPWQPKWLKRAMWWFADRAIVDPALAPGVNAFRAEFGLPPVRRIMGEWWNSPQRVIGLYPDWYGPPQPDWPGQVRLTGFPLYDERGLEPMPEALLRFLDAGEKPIAFTPGSAMWQGRKFFDAAVGTCKLLGRRGILLSRQRGHIPPDLPPGVIHVDYAPFSELLPRVAALVHHGGVGTTSQALAAGVPQLVTAMAHDQPDNGERLTKLGVGKWMWVDQFTPGRAARLLGELLASPTVASTCANVRARMKQSPSLDATCDLLEQLAATPAPTPVPSP